MKVRTWHAAVVLGLGTLVSHGFGLSLVPAMLPRIEDEFQSGYGILGVAVATGLLAYSLGSLATAPIMRLVPTRALLVGTYALSGAGFVVMAMASSPISISLAVVLLGISAPISWTATIHVARETVTPESLSIVSASASGGAAAGVIVNGILFRTSGSIHSWRVSFLIAAVVAGVVIGVTLILFRQPIPRPVSSGTMLFALYRKVLGDPSGRMIVITSGISGVAVFTLATFLTATAIDEMGVSNTATAMLLWIAGFVGVGSALSFGKLGDRRTPTFAITVAMGIYATSLIILMAAWSYIVLIVAVVGYGVLNGPVWGLMGAAANRRFGSELAVGAISLGLIAASVFGAIGNSATGIWIENTGSLRGPVAMLAVLTTVLTMYLIRETRRSDDLRVSAVKRST